MLMEIFQKRLQEKPVPNQYESQILAKDGRSVPVEVTASKTRWQGRPAVMGIIRDITDRRKREEEKTGRGH